MLELLLRGAGAVVLRHPLPQPIHGGGPVASRRQHRFGDGGQLASALESSPFSGQHREACPAQVGLEIGVLGVQANCGFEKGDPRRQPVRPPSGHGSFRRQPQAIYPVRRAASPAQYPRQGHAGSGAQQGGETPEAQAVFVRAGRPTGRVYRSSQATQMSRHHRRQNGDRRDVKTEVTEAMEDQGGKTK